jgi:putative endonuclease
VSIVIARNEATKQSKFTPQKSGLLRCARNDEAGQLRQAAVYIMATRRNGTLYTGVTSNLPQRVWMHRTGAVPGFTLRHNCKMLVWYELHATMPNAILAKSRLRAGREERSWL